MADRRARMTVGFPRMHKEAGERRDWLPELVAVAAQHADVVVETGIGSSMGLVDADYLRWPGCLRIGTNEEAFEQDVVVALRSPENEEFAKLRPGATLMAMLHYRTRPSRIARLSQLGVEAVSLDGVADDAGRRLVVNARAVAWNGLEAAFDALEREWIQFRDPGRPPLGVLVLGVGTVGRHAVEASTKLGNPARRDLFMEEGLPGAIVKAVGRNVTADERTMRALFRETDLLVDASQREDTARPLVPNAWLDDLPSHAVICDLVVDPYLPDAEPPTVRSIEGIPRGDLDRYVFRPSDPGWCDSIPCGISTEHRRTAVSCYSWPGVHPRACMQLYGAQVAPLLEVLIERGGATGLCGDGAYHERALHGAWLRAWVEANTVGAHGGRGSLGDRAAS
jgi:alanine dehydrogenase